MTTSASSYLPSHTEDSVPSILQYTSCNTCIPKFGYWECQTCWADRVRTWGKVRMAQIHGDSKTPPAPETLL